MTREEALFLLKNKLKMPNLISHSLAVEAVMRELAGRLSEDEDKWGLAGLLHDLDYEETKNQPEKHSLIGAVELEKMGLAEEIVGAVRTHNDFHNLPRETKMAKALFCTDPLTGLIVASALVLPEKKLSGLAKESVLRRFREKAFARGANRETINSCGELGLKLEEFVDLGLRAMQKIASQIGL